MEHRLAAALLCLQAVAAALDGLIADGTYRALLAKWHLADNGIEKATVNAGR